MIMVEALFLGIVQGLTEFLPISSSGHLLLIQYILGWDQFDLAFDVALHFGTFLAVVCYFFPVWRDLITKGFFQRQAAELRLVNFLILATIPAAVAGFLGESAIHSIRNAPIVAAIMLIVFGLLLGYADRRSEKNSLTVGSMSLKDAVLIGLSQMLALMPGVSRSGVTITTGLLLGLKKEEATRFSFLLLAPISLGAAVTQFDAIITSQQLPAIAVGTITSFLVGLGAIHLLLQFLRRYGFMPYVWYRVVVGLLFLLLLI